MKFPFVFFLFFNLLSKLFQKIFNFKFHDAYSIQKYDLQFLEKAEIPSTRIEFVRIQRNEFNKIADKFIDQSIDRQNSRIQFYVKTWNVVIHVRPSWRSYEGSVVNFVLLSCMRARCAITPSCILRFCHCTAI